MTVTALNRWLVAQAALWTPLLLLAAGGMVARKFESWWLWIVAASMLWSYLALWVLLRAGRTVADRVTGLRFLGLLVVLLVAARQEDVTWLLWGALLIVVLLDLLDGWCARRFGGSEEGAILDMETDQLTTLGLSLLAAGYGKVGAWLLLLPGFRYLYILALRARGRPAHDPKPREGDNTRGRLVCAFVMGSLLACLLPSAPAYSREAIGIIAVLVLAWSFASDARFLLRDDRDPDPVP
jgi:phosphatidylglycerophosphate synthase